MPDGNMTDAYKVNNMNNENKGPIKAVIVGAGHRSLIYSSYALQNPDKLQITGIVDPDDNRIKQAAQIHQVPAEACFHSVEELLNAPKLGDAVINGTMDKLHIPTTLPLLEAGYDILLEKPIGVSKEEVLELLVHARKFGRKVLICHVLRYAPFYLEIKKRIEAGEIGEIMTICTEENVSYHHVAVAFVRGKWNRKDVGGSSFLLAKCCHDLDLISWLKSGVRPAKVSSFGSRMFYRPEMAPAGAGTRCLTDCSIEDTCPYSARKNYVEQGLWNFYAWDSIENLGGHKATDEQKLQSLKTDNPYGRCVWKCDNDIVDHQHVIIEYEDGSTATHNLNSAAPRGCRSIHIIGTKGEILGIMEDGCFEIRRPDARKDHLFSTERVDLAVAEDMHGDGDLRLVDDFVRVLSGLPASISSTTIEDSIYGHVIGFNADQSRLEGKVVEIEEL